VLQEGEHGAAVGEAGVGHAAEFQLGVGGEAAEVEGFEGAFGEEEAAVEEGRGFPSRPLFVMRDLMLGILVVGGLLVRGMEETVAWDEAAEGEGGGGGGDGEGEGGVEEGEGAVDEAEGAERVGCCEGGGGEGGEGEAQAGGGGEVEERWEALMEVQWADRMEEFAIAEMGSWEHTSRRCCQCAVGVVAVPVRGGEERVLDIVHEVEHLADAQGSRLRSWSLASLQGP